MSNNQSMNDLYVESARVAKLQADAMHNEGKRAYDSGDMASARHFAAILKSIGKPGYSNLTGSEWSRQGSLPINATIKLRGRRKTETGELSAHNKRMRSLIALPNKGKSIIRSLANSITDDELRTLYGPPPRVSPFAALVMPSNAELDELRLPASNNNSGYSSSGSNGSILPPYPPSMGGRRRRQTRKHKRRARRSIRR